MNATTNTTHLMWVGRWIEVRVAEPLDREDSYSLVFKSGRDAADWLRA